MSALTEEEEWLLAVLERAQWGQSKRLAALARRLAARVETLEGVIRTVRGCDVCGEDWGRCMGCDRRMDAALSVPPFPSGTNPPQSAGNIPSGKEAPTRATTYDSDDVHPGSGRLLSASPVFATPAPTCECACTWRMKIWHTADCSLHGGTPTESCTFPAPMVSWRKFHADGCSFTTDTGWSCVDACPSRRAGRPTGEGGTTDG